MSLAQGQDLPVRPVSSRVLAWLGMALAVLLLWAVPLAFEFPEPKSGIRLSKATLVQADGLPQQVDLPFLWSTELAQGPASASFWISFDPSQLTQRPLALLIPAARQPMTMLLNGQPLEPIGRNSWSSARGGYFKQAILPDARLVAGENWLELRLDRSDGWISGYLSPVHVMWQADLEESLKVHDFVIEQGQSISFALHLLIAISIFVVLALRRQDAIFLWFSLIGVASLPVVALQAPLLAPMLGEPRVVILALQLLVSLLVVSVTCVVRGHRPSLALRLTIVALPLALLVLSSLPFVPDSPVVLANALMIAVAYLVAAYVLAQYFARQKDWVAAVLCPPCALAGLCALHDTLLSLGVISGNFMLAPYARFVLLAAVMALLIGHLIQSLNRGDASQALLQLRLAEQEVELSRLHRDERDRIGQQILVRERERLMRDLHDGISGHLVSILAQAEKQGGQGLGIQVSAGEALSDLRMVVQSLDLGEDDMRLALAGFYERLQPQLRRLGVRLVWSMENLPEVSGMTSGNALAILRILQEAVTNALKHGPASEITVLGRAPASGGAELVISNDRMPDVVRQGGHGHGLTNMRRRAQDFGGELNLSLTPTRATLSLTMPLRLSEVLAAPMS